MFNRRYNGLTVSRPVVAMGISSQYLPGSLDEKMRPWLQPIHDALDLLMRPFAPLGPRRKQARRSHSGAKKPYEVLMDQGIEIEALCYILLLIHFEPVPSSSMKPSSSLPRRQKPSLPACRAAQSCFCRDLLISTILTLTAAAMVSSTPVTVERSGFGGSRRTQSWRAVGTRRSRAQLM